MALPNEIFTMPVKSRTNEYSNSIGGSQGVIKSRQEPIESASQMPLGKANNTNMSKITSKNGIRNSSNQFGSGLPSLPQSNPPHHTFVKGKIDNTNPMKIDNTNPMKTDNTNAITIPDQNGDHYPGRHLVDSDSTKVKIQYTGYVSSVEGGTRMDYDGGYLMPADPPSYSDFCYTNSSTTPPGSDSSANIQRKPDRPKHRSDSGFEDGDSAQGSGSVRFSTSTTSSSHSVFSPRLSTQFEQHYEDIDQYNTAHGHAGQHRSQRDSSEKLGNGSVRMHQLPQVDISGGTSSDTEDNDLGINLSMAETILEPLHDPRVGSLPHTYMPLKTSGDTVGSLKLGQPMRRDNCWLTTGLLVILLISLAALSLSIYTLILINNVDFKDGKSDLLPTISTGDYDLTSSSLEDKIDDLLKENAALKDVLLAQEKNLTTYVEQQVTQLSYQQHNLSSSLELMEDKFDAKISLISLIPGPQGPPGVSNFSLCVNRSVSRSAAASSKEPTETSYLPTEFEIERYFVTFAYCAYNGATDAYLEALQHSSNNRQRYRFWKL